MKIQPLEVEKLAENQIFKYDRHSAILKVKSIQKTIVHIFIYSIIIFQGMKFVSIIALGGDRLQTNCPPV